MKRARTTFAVAAVAAATLLSSCATSSGGGGSSSGSSSTGSGGSSGSSTGKVTLRFQSLAFQNPTIAATKKIVADFNKQDPNVQVQYVQGSWDSVHDQLVTQFQGGSAPDIIHDEAADISGFAKQGYLADLGPLLSADTKSSFAPLAPTVTVGGKLVAAPTLLQSYVVFANTKLLKQAGVALPTGSSWTWDQFAAAAKKATKGSTYGLGWGLKQPTATVMSMALNYGGTFFSGDGKTLNIGQKEMEVPKRIHDMAYVDKSIDPTSLTQAGSDVFTAFLKGKYAMTVGGNYSAQQLTQSAPKGFSWAVLPPLMGTTTEQAADPQTLSVAKQSKNVAAAAKFVDFYMKADNLAAEAQGDWLIPTTAASRAAVKTATGGKNGWTQTLASGEKLVQAPFQSAEKYPQWKDQIATPALQQYFSNKTDAAGLKKALTSGWAQVSGS